MNRYFEAVKKGGDFWKNYLSDRSLARSHFENNVTPAVRDYTRMEYRTWQRKHYPNSPKYA